MKSPWGNKRWSPETYIAFHALRTYTSLICTKNFGEAVVSLRIIRSRIKTILDSNDLKGAFREFVRRYRKAIKMKKKHYLVVDCQKFFEIDRRALKFIHLHSEIEYLDLIDKGLKKIFGS